MAAGTFAPGRFKLAGGWGHTLRLLPPRAAVVGRDNNEAAAQDMRHCLCCIR